MAIHVKIDSRKEKLIIPDIPLTENFLAQKLVFIRFWRWRVCTVQLWWSSCTVQLWQSVCNVQLWLSMCSCGGRCALCSCGGGCECAVVVEGVTVQLW